MIGSMPPLLVAECLIFYYVITMIVYVMVHRMGSQYCPISINAFENQLTSIVDPFGSSVGCLYRSLTADI